MLVSFWFHFGFISRFGLAAAVSRCRSRSRGLILVSCWYDFSHFGLAVSRGRSRNFILV